MEGISSPAKTPLRMYVYGRESSKVKRLAYTSKNKNGKGMYRLPSRFQSLADIVSLAAAVFVLDRCIRAGCFRLASSAFTTTRLKFILLRKETKCVSLVLMRRWWLMHSSRLRPSIHMLPPL